MRGAGRVSLLGTMCLVAAWPVMAYAQGTITFAQLNGAVRAASGAPLQGATVSVRDLETNRTATSVTNEAGNYVVPNLPPGRYELTVELGGFSTYTQTGLVLTVGQTATADVTLALAGIAETVTVTAEGRPIEPTRTEISQTIVLQQIQSLPVSGRLFTDFALLAPGVSTGRTSLGTTVTEFEITQLSFGGMRSFSNLITVDGADFINANTGVQRATPPQESVQEFRVVNNSFGAEYGRALGGIVNVVTRSGTNSWRGSAYQYFQNDALNARSLLNPEPRPNTLEQIQFGAAIGGPIKRNRTWIFANYEGLRRDESPYLPPSLLRNIDAINRAKAYLGIPAENLEVVKTKITTTASSGSIIS